MAWKAFLLIGFLSLKVLLMPARFLGGGRLAFVLPCRQRLASQFAEPLIAQPVLRASWSRLFHVRVSHKVKRTSPNHNFSERFACVESPRVEPQAFLSSNRFLSVSSRGERWPQGHDCQPVCAQQQKRAPLLRNMETKRAGFRFRPFRLNDWRNLLEL
jgi:hypothetical protein